MTKLKEEIWASLKDRVNRALKHEKQNLGTVFLELKQLSRTLDELAEMKKADEYFSLRRDVVRA